MVCLSHDTADVFVSLLKSYTIIFKLNLICTGKALGDNFLLWFDSQLWCCREQSGSGLSQWEMTLHCSIIPHWLSPYPEWSLCCTPLLSWHVQIMQLKTLLPVGSKQIDICIGFVDKWSLNWVMARCLLFVTYMTNNHETFIFNILIDFPLIDHRGTHSWNRF